MTTLEDRIIARLEAALQTAERTGVSTNTRRGLAYGGPVTPVIGVTLEQVAALAVAEMRNGPAPTADRPEGAGPSQPQSGGGRA